MMSQIGMSLTYISPEDEIATTCRVAVGQEALTNTPKHAQAQILYLQLRFEPMPCIFALLMMGNRNWNDDRHHHP